MKIRLLSDSVINKIATGEVIDRPLSVVKELIENSIDAGATEIHVNLYRGGRSLISVTDNGCGIDKEDLLLAVTRHATSKLFDDITQTHYMGFRGEALASMITASRVKLISRTRDQQGWQIILENGSLQDEIHITPASHNIGTTVEIRDLFCFIPNRLRFLKPESTEIAACSQFINSIALAYPHIQFSCISNNKDILNILFSKNRIQTILGEEFLNNANFFDTGENYKDLHRMRLYGYVSIPTYNRTTHNKIFTFVNKRLVKDSFLNKLIRVAYFNTLPEGIHPSVVLFLEMPVECVDVNIHPNKSEVRFSDERIIRDIIIHSIRDTIKSTKTITPTIKNLTQDTIKPLQLVFNNDNSSLCERNVQNFSTLCHSEYLGNAKFQLYNQYIIAENAKGMVLIDQHAAHERIVLEKLQSMKIHCQNLLIPISISLEQAKIDLIMSIASDLQRVGFHITTNDCMLFVHSIPLLPGNFDVLLFLQDVVNDTNLYMQILASHQTKILQKIACYSSIRAGRKMNIQEMNALLRLIETTNFSSQCVHGRPTYIELSMNYLNKLFERS